MLGLPIFLKQKITEIAWNVWLIREGMAGHISPYYDWVQWVIGPFIHSYSQSQSYSGHYCTHTHTHKLIHSLLSDRPPSRSHKRVVDPCMTHSFNILQCVYIVGLTHLYSGDELQNRTASYNRCGRHALLKLDAYIFFFTLKYCGHI